MSQFIQDGTTQRDMPTTHRLAYLPGSCRSARQARINSHCTEVRSNSKTLDLSFVIPVFNGAHSVEAVVDEICAELHGRGLDGFEIVLVNDGSFDHSEEVCLRLTAQYRNVTLVQLDANFGEHNAVVAGLTFASGRHICVMDDDGQNSPADAVRMLAYLKEHGHDVVYVQYRKRWHSAFRVAGSVLNDRAATMLLQKPQGLYLSSFKVMTREIAVQTCRTCNSKPYLDALILRATKNIGQVIVEHRPRSVGQSGYTLAKLLDLWFSMALGASIGRLQLAFACASLAFSVVVLTVSAIFANWAFFTPPTSDPITSVIAAGAVFTALQFAALGGLGFHLRRVLTRRQEAPPYVLRYVRYPEDRTAQNITGQTCGRLNAEVIS